MMKIKRSKNRRVSLLLSSVLTGATLTLVTPFSAYSIQDITSSAASCAGSVANNNFNASASFTTSFAAANIARWEYSYDKSYWITVPNSAQVSSASVTVNNWYDNTFHPWVRVVSTNGVNGTESRAAAVSSACSGANLTNPSAPPPSSWAYSVSSSNSNGTYTVGSTAISIQVNFRTAVNVTGTPKLELETGDTNRLADYSSGSGTTSLTFTYVVSAGDTSADLDYASINSLTLNGGTIVATSDSTDAILNLPAPGATGSLRANKALVIDTTAPTLVSFTSTTANGVYQPGSSINVTATLSKSVLNTARLTVTLDTGATLVLSRTNTGSTLTGTYIVASGQTTLDMTVNSFVLTVAPVDSAGNVMSSTDIPSGSNIADAKAIVIEGDTTAPTLSSTSASTAATTATLRFTSSEAGTYYYVIYAAGDSAPSAATVQAQGTALKKGTASTLSGSISIGVSALSENTNYMAYVILKDNADNVSLVSPITVNTKFSASPSVPATPTTVAGNTQVTVTVTAPVEGVTPTSYTVLGYNNAGTAIGSCSISGSSGSCSVTGLTNGQTYTFKAKANASGYTDSAYSLASLGTIPSAPDTTAPTVIGVTSTNGTYKTGDVVTIVVAMSEAVMVTGSPTLVLATTPTSRNATYASGSGTNSLTFNYTVQETDTAADLNYAAISSLSGTIKDASDNSAILTLPGLTSAGSLGTNQAIVIDTTAPTQTISGIGVSVDTGNSATDFNTSTASQAITATLSAGLGTGETLWASVNGGSSYMDITASSVSSTAISWTSALLSGSNSIKFQVRDSAGNIGATATQAYVLDSTVPVPTVATVVVISPTAVAVRSSEIGTAYLVKTTVTVSNLASITGAADDSMNQVAIAAADTDTTMSTAGLIPGDYKLYVVDAAGNLSLASNNIVTVAAATAPTATSTSAPTGTTTVGSTLTNAVTFIGLPVPTLSYQWKICTNATETATVCSDISGATGSTFIANAIDLVGKFIRVLVTAVNGVSPDAIEWSSPTAAIVAVVPPAPAPVVPPAPAPVVPPAPICDAACVAEQNAIIAKIIADRIAAEAKVVSDAAAKVVAEKVVVDKAAAVAAAKAAVEKAATAVLAKAAADTAALEATAVAKAAADAQIAAADAASKASAVLKSATTTAAAKAAATANATKAATTAANAVNVAAVAARRAAVARATAANASKQVEIALGALASKTAAATNVAQANAIAAAAKAAANAAAKAAADQALTARAASNNANNEATIAVERVATKQTEAATAAVEAKIAADAALNATNEKISAAAEAQRSAEAVVKALEEKIVLAEAAVNAKDVTERAAIEKKIEEATAKVAEAQRIADAANTRSEAAVVALERAQTAATLATQKAQLQAAEMVAVRAESTAKTAIATTAAETASLAAKVAAAAKAAAAKIPARAAISARPGTTSKNSARATITGLKPGQKVKVTVNVKGK
jgi:hypothetical protein